MCLCVRKFAIVQVCFCVYVQVYKKGGLNDRRWKSQWRQKIRRRLRKPLRKVVAVASGREGSRLTVTGNDAGKKKKEVTKAHIEV